MTLPLPEKDYCKLQDVVTIIGERVINGWNKNCTKYWFGSMPDYEKLNPPAIIEEIIDDVSGIIMAPLPFCPPVIESIALQKFLLTRPERLEYEEQRLYCNKRWEAVSLLRKFLENGLLKAYLTPPDKSPSGEPYFKTSRLLPQGFLQFHPEDNCVSIDDDSTMEVLHIERQALIKLLAGRKTKWPALLEEARAKTSREKIIEEARQAIKENRAEPTWEKELRRLSKLFKKSNGMPYALNTLKNYYPESDYDEWKAEHINNL